SLASRAKRIKSATPLRLVTGADSPDPPISFQRSELRENRGSRTEGAFLAGIEAYESGSWVGVGRRGGYGVDLQGATRPAGSALAAAGARRRHERRPR